MAGLKKEGNIRQRLCNQAASLGNAAGLYLVIAVAGYLSPPMVEAKGLTEEVIRDLYGMLMFFGAISLTFYIVISLTVVYPLLESIPDYTAYEAHEQMMKNWGGYEQFLFNFGGQAVLIALVIVSRVLYSWYVTAFAIIIFIMLYCTGAFLTRANFLSIDPITSMHMGLTNDPKHIVRASRLADLIRRNGSGAGNCVDRTSSFADTIAEQQSRLSEFTESSVKRANSELSAGAESKTRVRTFSIEKERKEAKRARNRDNDEDDSSDDSFPKNAESRPARRKDSTDSSLSMVNAVPIRKMLAQKSLPSLEKLLLGEARALNDDYLTVEEASSVYTALKRQGCRSSEKLLDLLESVTVFQSDDFRDDNDSRRINAGATQKARLDMLISFGIPGFHAAELVRYVFK